MRKSSLIGLAVFGLGIGFLVYAYLPQDGSDTGNKELYDYSSNGLELNVVTNGDTFSSGDEILVEATLINDLGAPVTYNNRCGEPIQIEVKAEEIDNYLVKDNGNPPCDEEKGETERMISNEQLTKTEQFKLEIPLNDQSTTLTPAGSYIISITFHPTAQSPFNVEIPININQKTPDLVNVSKAKQLALQSYKAQVWFDTYDNTEKYLVSEEVPYIENGEWVFKWKAMNTDQSVPSEDAELTVTERAVNRD
ncbi:hypothetical protein E2R51_14280 [Jeotgalibacillus sp. S-D1]|uniref:hypothetical protein n=1 Tax=Jeotgalibacillus sp. S-D1 TaxID=2552189 RepID=UPI00105A9887|nr:hypothetical protein [Jeotgalibacillus sp. S-D1]TDL31525.1 hypothetical protein E2R51_14280 [Jeotgalibacillus sp. S-D1]